MTLVVTHTFVSGIADGADNTLVRPSNWNANHTLTGLADVTQGGTGIASGTSGGIPYFSASTTLASSAALTANALVLGGGAGVAPTVVGSLGTTTTVLHGNASGAPTFGAVALTTDVSGTLPIGSGGTNQTSFTSNAVNFFDGTHVASMAGTSWDNTNKALTISGATVTTSNPILNLSQTWNAGAVTFTSLLLNVTNTASANPSRLLDLQIGGSPIYRFLYSSNQSQTTLTFTQDGNGSVLLDSNAGTLTLAGSSVGNAATIALLANNGVCIGGVSGARIYADALDQLALGRSTNAQAFRVYNTTDTVGAPTNYERGVFDWTTTVNVLTIGATAGGTGTTRPVAMVAGGNEIIRLLTAGNVKFSNAASFSANGAVATSLGSIGPTGSHTTVQTWLTFQDSGGVTRYVPCF